MTTKLILVKEKWFKSYPTSLIKDCLDYQNRQGLVDKAANEAGLQGSPVTQAEAKAFDDKRWLLQRFNDDVTSVFTSVNSPSHGDHNPFLKFSNARSGDHVWMHCNGGRLAIAFALEGENVTIDEEHLFKINTDDASRIMNLVSVYTYQGGVFHSVGSLDEMFWDDGTAKDVYVSLQS